MSDTDMLRTEILNVLHPAPMTVRRKRARKRELVFVLQETPLTLRRVEHGALGPVLDAPRNMLHAGETWHAFEGSLWYRLRGVSTDPFRASPWDRFGLAEFAGFLRRDRPWPEIDDTDVGQSFVRTPLIAAGVGGRPATRGVPWGEWGLGGPSHPVSEVYADGRSTAVPSLHAFMDARVIVAGDAVLVRMAPLAGIVCDLPVLQPFPRARAPSERKGMGMALGHRLDLFCEAMAWEHGMTSDEARQRIGRDPHFYKLAEFGSGSDTACLIANFAATAAHEAFLETTWAGGGYLEGGSQTAVATLLAMGGEVSAWGERAALGLIDEVEAVQAVACAARAAGAIRAACRTDIRNPPSILYVDDLVHRFKEFEWPHVEPATVSDADSEVLAALVM